jgi:hypothetical protein
MIPTPRANETAQTHRKKTKSIVLSLISSTALLMKDLEDIIPRSAGTQHSCKNLFFKLNKLRHFSTHFLIFDRTVPPTVDPILNQTNHFCGSKRPREGIGLENQLLINLGNVVTDKGMQVAKAHGIVYAPLTKKTIILRTKP